MNNEDKKRLSYERQNAVRKAWKEEKERVANGQGTRRWSEKEQQELLNRGSVKGYEGHHMKSASLFPEHAGDSKNIQFLTEEEHLHGAHKGNYHNLTNGYYDPETKTMHEFQDNELKEVPVVDLTQTESESNNNSNNNDINKAREEYCKDAEKENTNNTDNDKEIQDAKESISETNTAEINNDNENDNDESNDNSNERD